MSVAERETTDLRGYIAAARRRRSVLLLAPALVTAAVIVFSVLQTPVYAGQARLLVAQSQSPFGTQDTGRTQQETVQTEMQVISSKPVRDLVRRKVGTAPKVSASEVGTTAVVQLGSESRNARRAAAITNAYAEAYLQYRRQQADAALATASQEIQGKVDDLQRQIDDLSGQLSVAGTCPPSTSGSCPKRDSIQRDRDALVTLQVPFKQRLAELQVNTAVYATGSVVTPASVPTDPVRPRVVRNAMLGLVVGLLLGACLALLLEYLDDRVRDAEDLEGSAGGVAVLAAIPAMGGSREDVGRDVSVLSAPTSATAEAYRTLRTSIRFLGVDRPLRTIQITSPNAGEGKTTTSANLAAVLAAAGERVVLVSCDLRRPRVHRHFGLSNDVGLTSVLLDETPLVRALQAVGGQDRLLVLATGPLPPNPSELLSSARLTSLLDEISGQADAVVIDSPPVLPVTDAVVLAAKVDCTLLVVAAQRTARKEVTHSAKVLQQVNAPLLGAILTNAPAETTYAYGYTSDDRAVERQGQTAKADGADGRATSPTGSQRDDRRTWPDGRMAPGNRRRSRERQFRR
jgi:succinoglycan biosynthesis transport protein ExoP